MSPSPEPGANPPEQQSRRLANKEGPEAERYFWSAKLCSIYVAIGYPLFGWIVILAAFARQSAAFARPDFVLQSGVLTSNFVTPSLLLPEASRSQVKKLRRNCQIFICTTNS